MVGSRGERSNGRKRKRKRKRGTAGESGSWAIGENGVWPKTKTKAKTWNGRAPAGNRRIRQREQFETMCGEFFFTFSLSLSFSAVNRSPDCPIARRLQIAGAANPPFVDIHFGRVGFSLLHEVNPTWHDRFGGRVADSPCQVRSIPIEAPPTPRKSDLRRPVAWD
jgi:hypothetical protein